ncbi:hypothetical protein VRY85_12770 [Achromobacter sp. F4_2707]|uniref:hypothetical protein n=1 Tax=Achromobacter sp. F4_2707 TaxID=3114286 RepID=UPI0039C5FD0B
MKPLVLRRCDALHAVFRWGVLPGVLAGCVLHAYTCFFVPEGGPDVFTSGLFMLSILPYLACVIVGLRHSRGPLMAVCAILPILLLDILAFHEAFITPSTSTSSLVLLVVPVINLGVLLLGFLVGWIAATFICRKSRTASR